MRKNLDCHVVITLLAMIIFFVFAPTNASAVLITKNLEGEIRSNVLGVSSEEGLQLITNSIENLIAQVSVNIVDNSLVLSFDDSNEEKIVDLDNFEGDLVEIEQENESNRIYLATNNNIFYIKQRGITAESNFEIELNSITDEIIMNTDSGTRKVSILPYDAVQPLIKANILDDINSEGEILLTEREEGELVYEVTGSKKYSVFSFFNLPADIIVSVSAQTGNVLSVKAPSWSRLLSFLSA